MQRRRFFIPLVLLLLLFTNGIVLYDSITPPKTTWTVRAVKAWDNPTSTTVGKITPQNQGVVIYTTAGGVNTNIKYTYFSSDLRKGVEGEVVDRIGIEYIYPLDNETIFDFRDQGEIYKNGEKIDSGSITNTTLYKLKDWIISQEIDTVFFGLREIGVYTADQFHLVFRGQYFPVDGEKAEVVYIDVMWENNDFTFTIAPIDRFFDRVLYSGGALYVISQRNYSKPVSIENSIISSYDIKTGNLGNVSVETLDLSTMGIRGIPTVYEGFTSVGDFHLVKEYDYIEGVTNIYIVDEGGELLVQDSWKQDVSFSLQKVDEFRSWGSTPLEVGNIPLIMGNPFIPLERGKYREPEENITLGYMIKDSSVISVIVDSSTPVNVTDSPKIEFIGASDDNAYFLVTYSYQTDLVKVSFNVEVKRLADTRVWIGVGVLDLVVLITYLQLLRRKKVTHKLYP